MPNNPYKRYRFPPEVIQYAVWLYYRFNLSHRDIEDLLAERGIVVSYESIRLWCNKFGPQYAQRLKQRHRGFGDTFFIDEVFVKIRGKQQYLWRAVDQYGEVVDVFLLFPVIIEPGDLLCFASAFTCQWQEHQRSNSL